MQLWEHISHFQNHLWRSIWQHLPDLLSILQLRKNWNIDFDDAGAIGRRYRRQDEIGTPYCITIDFETLDDNAVTIRDRDTMAQERISLDQVQAWLAPRLLGC